MVSLNVSRITINEAAIKKIVNVVNCPTTQKRWTAIGTGILNDVYPKIPYNPNSKNKEHMRDKYYVTPLKKFRFKYKGEYVNSVKVDIRPKGKYLPYYGVMSAGVRNGKKLEYQNELSSAYFLQAEVKINRWPVMKEMIELFQKEITKIDKVDNE